MGMILCPRCELNYMDENDKVCKICLREIKGTEPKDEIELCTICNEAPAIPGRDVCLFCMREMNKQKKIGKEEIDEPVDTDENLESDLDPDLETPEIDDDKDSELEKLDDELSLEELGEQEEEENEDSDEEND